MKQSCVELQQKGNMVMTDNIAFIQQVNDAFARNDTAFFEANLADDVRWTMVGSPAIVGKAAVIAEFQAMEEGPTPELSITNIIDGGASVAVEGTVTMVEEPRGVVTYGFCDVYGLTDQDNGRITSITAYIVELSTGDAS